MTNSLRVANLFSGNAGAWTARPTRWCLTGGIRTPSDALVGPMADLTIKSLHFDTLFLGCHGIDPEAGLTTPNLAEAETNRTFIKARPPRRGARRPHQVGRGQPALVRAAEEVNVLITDDMLPADARAAAARR